MKCPYCKDYVSVSDIQRFQVCQHCHTHYHVECWVLSQGCAVFGCQGTLKKQPEGPETFRLIDAHYNQAVSLMKASIHSPDTYVQLVYRYGAFANIDAVCKTLQDLFFNPEIPQNLFRKLKPTVRLHQAHDFFVLLNVANLAMFLAEGRPSAKRYPYRFPQTELKESKITTDLYAENVLKRISINCSEWVPQYQALLSSRNDLKKSTEIAWETQVFGLACHLCFGNRMTLKRSVTDVRFFGQHVLTASFARFEDNCHYLWHWGPEDFTGLYFIFERLGLDAGRGRAFREELKSEL